MVGDNSCSKQVWSVTILVANIPAFTGNLDLPVIIIIIIIIKNIAN